MCSIHTARQCLENQGITCNKDCPNLLCPMNKDHDPKNISYSKENKKPYRREQKQNRMIEILKQRALR